MLRQLFGQRGSMLLIIVLLSSAIWFPGSGLAAPLRAISSYQATNDATNVYYQLNYTTTYTFYRVYIDPDQSTGTGFQIGGIGASYLVENGTLYPYTGNGTSWSWGTGTTVGYTNSAGVANWTIARSAIGETANPNWADLIFQVEAPITSSAKYTHVYSGTATNTPTRTNTPVPTNTPTRTNTPTGPTNTPTRTNTPTSCGTICNQQATNDATNVYYQFNYTGTFSWYRVYIDTDQSTGTGFQTGGIGANYLVENGTVFPYTGTGTNWSWGTGTAVTFSSAGGLAQWTINRSTIGETANPNSANLLFQVEAPLFTTGIYTHTYSGGATSTPTNTSVGPTNTPTRTSTPGGGATVNYTASSAVITNPERGFDHTNTACESSLYSVATLQGYRTSENISLVLCNFYLTSFKTSPISQAALNTLQTQLNTIRTAGLKVVLRFAYSSTDNVDATLTQIQAHINQLAPIIQSNTDVIYIWQAGFIGQWGEWYYTNHFGDLGVISPQQWADRKAVVDAMLAALPTTRMVSLRTPNFMRTMYGTTTVNSGTAFNGSAVARLGQHNDAFVSTADDMGTYLDTSVEYPWLQAQSTYTVMGGENDAWMPPRSDCATAMQEMGMFHWSYINTDYFPTTISNWQSHGCYSTMQKNLGYRFVLTQGIYPGTATSGGGLNVQISIRNDGYSAPINPRGRELILRNTSNGTVYHFALTSDPRFWLSGTTTTINQTVTLTGVPAGNYALLLNLPDPISGLSTRPEYSIQTANTGTWEASTGYNNLLHTVTVQ